MVEGVELTPGEAAAYAKAPEAKKERLLDVIKASRAQREKQRAEVAAKGSKELRRKEDGTVEGLSYGTVIPLQERDKEYWTRVKGDPQKEERLLAVYQRRTQATREEIIAFLES